jgi:hypothetical protein
MLRLLAAEYLVSEAVKYGGIGLDILEITDSVLTLGSARNWARLLFDSKVLIDRANSEIVLFDKAFGLVSERRIPMSSVDSVKMSVRIRRAYNMPVYRMVPTNPARIDLWIDVREMGKIELDTHYGVRSDANELASLGSRVAQFMQRPFVDTSKW